MIALRLLFVVESLWAGEVTEHCGLHIMISPKSAVANWSFLLPAVTEFLGDDTMKLVYCSSMEATPKLTVALE